MKKIGISILMLLIINSTLFAKNDDVIKDLVIQWNELHNTRDIEKFRGLYADQVLYYGRNYTGHKCYQRKKAFLTPDFKQDIISKIIVSNYTSGTVKAAFSKRVTFKKKINEYDCYLLFEKKGGQYLIKGESDLITDKNLGINVMLGEEAPLSNQKYGFWAFTLLTLCGSLLYYYRKKRNHRKTTHITHDHSFSPEESFVNVKSRHEDDRQQIIETVKVAVLKEMSEENSVMDIGKRKGDEFEKYVVRRFKPEYFTLNEWRSDKYHEGIYAKTNLLPDMEYRFKSFSHDVKFAVECKWRSKFIYGKVEWAKEHQLKTYKDYERKNRICVFVIIGIGGQPNNPNSIYTIPLRDVNSNILEEKELKNYLKYGNGDFFLDPRLMTLS